MTVSGVVVVALYVVLVCTPAALAAWLAPAAGGFVYEAGRAAALTGFTILVLQTVLAARFKAVSRPFGLDIVLRFHRNIAIFAGVLLLYANRTESAIVFGEELAEIASGHYPHLSVVHVISRPGDEWAGERGHIDGDLLKRHIEGDVSKKVFYVCGPGPLMDAVIADLSGMGVKDRQIRTEIFRLID